MYGDLELVGFENAQGSFNSIYAVKLSYLVKNGPLNAVIDAANINSPFQPAPFNAISSKAVLTNGEQLLVFTDTTVIDALAKYNTKTTFTFTLDASARGKISDIVCVASATYTF